MFVPIAVPVGVSVPVSLANLRSKQTGPRYAALSADTVALLVYLVHGAYWQITDQTDESDSVVDTALDEILRGGMIGQILWLAIDAAPAGTLVCDGSTYNRSEYPALYDSLPGSMKTASTFTLPNLINQTVRGSVSPGSTGGNDSVTLTVDQLPPHTHTYTPPVINLDLESPGVPDISAAGIGAIANTGSAGSGDVIDITNAYVGLLPVIIAS